MGELIRKSHNVSLLMYHIVCVRDAVTPIERSNMTDSDNEKKAKVLHTRVPASLENELKTRARGLGLSVSTLVRNILGNTFGPSRM